jgi:RNA polymerase sigma-70 factor (ECF subfamily)
MNSMRDAAWAEAIRTGDEAAYEALFRAYYVRLCAFANRLVAAPDIAEELAQDVFVKLWRNRAGWRVRSSVRAYLYSAVRNTALNHLARRRTEQSHPPLASDLASPPVGTARLEEEHIARELAAAIERLPPRCREVIELRWRHQLKHAEIAHIMGISIKGVENQLARGLLALREDVGHRLR